MALNKAIDTITERDLHALVTQQEPEGRGLDYKDRLNLTGEAAKAEFRCDVTSFANSVGGDLIVGISDAKGLPQEVCGFELGTMSQEQYKLQIVEILQSRIKPRMQGVSIRIVPLSGGKYVAVIRIPKSFAKPHQVEVNNKDFQFWFRHDGGKQRMDIDELRSSLLSSNSLSERIRDFRLDRLGRIVSRDVPPALAEGTKVVMHLIPLNAFELGLHYDLVTLREQVRSLGTMFLKTMYDLPRYNFDGVFSHDKKTEESSAHSYVQVFHNGIVESVEGRLFSSDGANVLDSVYFEDMLLEAFSRYLSLQEQLGVTPPIIVAVSLLDIAGYSLTTPDDRRWHDARRSIQEPNVLIPETLVEDFKVDPATLMKPIFDRMWNAAGWPYSLNYDESGNRTPRR